MMLAPASSRGKFLIASLVLAVIGSGFYLSTKGRPSADQVFNGHLATAKIISTSTGNYALRSDGTVWYFVKRKDPTTGLDQFQNTKIEKLENITDLRSGPSGTFFALKSDGTVWGWGTNTYAELGIGNKQSQTTPVQLSNLAGIKQLFIATTHSFALDTDGNLWSWGLNDLGQLGIGKVAKSNDAASQPVVPQKIALAGVVDVFAPAFGVYFARLADGTVWGWGREIPAPVSEQGVVINNGVIHPKPISIVSLANTQQMGRVGNLYSVVKSDGTVWGWWPRWDKNPETFQLPNLVSIQRQTDQFFVKADGTLWSWATKCKLGINNEYSIGSKYYLPQPKEAVVLKGATRVLENNGTGVCFALTGDGKVLTWGTGEHKTFGDGTMTDRATPTEIPNLTNVTSIFFQGSDVYVLRADNTVWAWGSNVTGRLDTGKKLSQLVPIQLTNLPKITKIFDRGSLFAGNNELYFLGETGKVLTWASWKNDFIEMDGVNLLANSSSTSSSKPSFTAGSSTPPIHPAKPTTTQVSSCLTDPVGIASVVLEFTNPDGTKPTKALIRTSGDATNGCWATDVGLSYNTKPASATYVFTQVATNALGAVTRSATSDIVVAANTPTEYIFGQGAPCANSDGPSQYSKDGGDFCITTTIKDPDTIDYLEMEFKRPDGTLATKKFGKEEKAYGPDSGDWTNGTWSGTASIPKHSSLDNPSQSRADEIYQLTMIAYDKTGASKRSGTSDVVVQAQ